MKSRALPEADHGYVRQPSPLLPLVDAEPLEAPENTACKPFRTAAFIGEDDHADTAGLPVANRLEHGWLDLLGGLACRLGDIKQALGRCPAEEGHGDMEVLRRDKPEVAAADELVPLPVDEAGDRVVRQEQRDEEPKVLMTLHVRPRRRANVVTIASEDASTREEPSLLPGL